MKNYSIVFFSSSEIAIPLLKKLASDKRFNILALFTQPDKEFGRNQRMKEVEIKKIAKKIGVRVFSPLSLKNDEESFYEMSKLNPDFFVTFAYGQILNKKWLDIPTIASLNIHASLLPKYRGASPIQSAILNFEEKSGISVMKMEEKMDTGPVYKQISLNIKELNAEELFNKISIISAENMPDILIDITEGLSPVDQIESEATYSKKISKEDGFVDFKKLTADQILQMYNAYSPWPGLWSLWNEKRFKILNIKRTSVEKKSDASEIICLDSKVYVCCKEGCIELLQVQVEGKKALKIEEFILGQKDFCGSRFS